MRGRGDRTRNRDAGPQQLRAILDLAARSDLSQTAPAGVDDRDGELLDAAMRQRGVIQLLQSGGPAMSDEGLARLDALQHDSARSISQGPMVWRSPAPRPMLAAGLAAVAAIVIATLSLTGGSDVLTAHRVADVWTLPPTSRVVNTNPAAPAQLSVSFRGTPYPNYHDSEGWHAVGTRSDPVNGTSAFTVYYGAGTRRAAYTVVAGTNVSVPATARDFRVNGLRLAEFRDGDRWVVVFDDHGNTCVLTAAAPRERKWLVKLAAWNGRAGVTPA